MSRAGSRARRRVALNAAKAAVYANKGLPCEVSKFSDFIRNASDEERKAVYEEVLAKATTRQLEVLHTAKEEAAKQSGVDEDELE